MSETETMTEPSDQPSPEADARQTFLRDAAIFHAKLIVDGLRDFALFPATLIAAAIDLIKREDPPGRHFYDVLHFGKQTEQWIDLFDAADRAPETDRPRPTIEVASFDDLADQFEQKIREEYEKGDVSASARRAVDKIVEVSQRMASSARGDDRRSGDPQDDAREEESHEQREDRRGDEGDRERE